MTAKPQNGVGKEGKHEEGLSGDDLSPLDPPLNPRAEARKNKSGHLGMSPLYTLNSLIEA